jgi:DNA-binding NarL/FixJ family response regulator
MDQAAEVAASRAGDAPNAGDDPSAAAGLAETIDLVRQHAFGLADAAGQGPGSEEAVVLRLLAQGLSDRELAQRLGVSPSTAHARKRAALDGLAAALRRAQAMGAERSGPGGQQPGMERRS